MARNYLSQHLREEMVKIMVSLSSVEVFKQDEARYSELFTPKAWGWMKQGTTLMLKSFSDGLGPNIGEYESAKIRELAKKFKIIMMRKTETLPKDTTSVPTGQLYDLAEKAMGNTCVGCTIVEFKGCELYQTLDGIDMPVACNEAGKCPFLQ
jgi:hypothetical protein